MDLDKLTKDAIYATIAKEILAGLDTAVRDTILQKAIAEALTGYEFTTAVKKVVAAKAEKVAAEMIECGYWTNRIRAAVSAGFEEYMTALNSATKQTLVEAFNGGKSSYSSYSGNILKHLSQ